MHKSPPLITKRKFDSIPKSQRLQWLQSQITKAMRLRATSIEGFKEYRGKRSIFSQMGPDLRDNQPCFVCDKQATIRHHVKPLILGGNNKFNNIVPLCHDCHTQVHKVGPREPFISNSDPAVIRIKELIKGMYP